MHEPIRNKFFRDMGNKLQYEDSQIAEKVVPSSLLWILVYQMKLKLRPWSLICQGLMVGGEGMVR